MTGPAASDSGKFGFRLPKAVLAACMVSLGCTAAVFALQFLPLPEATRVPRTASLAEFFPTTMNGWTAKDLPLAETEATVDQVEKILRFDEFVFRSYQKQGVEFSVYVAYWEPGRIAAREVAFHIPDKCWVAAGWKRQSATYDHTVSVAGEELAPAQLRQFSLSGNLQNVMYWHV